MCQIDLQQPHLIAGCPPLVQIVQIAFTFDVVHIPALFPFDVASVFYSLKL